MKKDEKTRLTRERIVQAAIQTFGTHGYAATAVNAICSQYDIAKGLFYHNFSGKDDLYLACVSRCFKNVIAYLKEHGNGADLRRYMELRFRYFSFHPCYARIFFEAVLQPPAGLTEDIRETKKEFDQFNRSIYRAALSEIVLRDGITEESALEYYEIMQEMFNGYFSSPAYAGKDFETIVADHEDKLSKMLDIMLYGLAEKQEAGER